MARRAVTWRSARGTAVLLACLLLPVVGLRAQSRCDEVPELEPGVVEGSTEGAPSEPVGACGVLGAAPADWYRFEAPEYGILRVESCGSDFDTVLSIHRCDDALAACNDDGCGLQSSVSHVVTEGDWLVRVTGFEGAEGTYRLETSFEPVEQLPESDDCGEAAGIGTGTWRGDLRDLTSDGSASCGRSDEAPDAWFRFTPAETGFYVVSTCGSEFDTVLSIHEGCPGTRANELSCNDDACQRQSTVGLRADAGRSYIVRVSGYRGAVGSYRLRIESLDLPPGDGPDLQVEGLAALREVGRERDVAALSVRTTICNRGSEPIEWFENPNPRHPFLVFNAYRLEDGRLEQIGQSWVKHGFSSSQSEGCGMICIPFGGHDYLGVGCADVYGVITNASQSTLGPRHEIDPFTGEFEWEGSWLQTRPDPVLDDVALRLQVRDEDVSPALHPDARFFFELYVLSRDETDRTNSLGHREMLVGPKRDGEWRLELQGDVRSGSILDRLDGARIAQAPEEVGPESDDGRVWVAARATELEDGWWRYEYDLFNLDLRRGIGSLRVPIHPATPVRATAFHAPRWPDDPVEDTPWTPERDDTGLVWQVATPGSEANALRWGLLYTFRFEAMAPPGDTSLALGVHDPGGPGALEAGSLGPSVPDGGIFRRGDADANGSIEITDAVFILEWLFTGGPPPSCLDAADTDDSGRLDLSDAVNVLLWLFAGASAPPAPGPESCGPDPTPDELPEACLQAGC